MLDETTRVSMVVYGGVSNAGTDAYVATPSPAFTAYAAGMAVLFRTDVANTAAATLNVNGLGAKNLKDEAGNALTTGVLRINQKVLAVYDGTDFKCVGVRVPTQHEVFLTTGNGHGSTNTKIRRFTSSVRNAGTAITYADSAGNGASFTINEDGYYAITYIDKVSNTESAGVSLNSAELTTSIASITNATRVLFVEADNASTQFLTMACTTYLVAGDVIRPHTNGATTSTSTFVSFRISKVG